jgi:hypothetical protein
VRMSFPFAGQTTERRSSSACAAEWLRNYGRPAGA